MSLFEILVNIFEDNISLRNFVRDFVCLKKFKMAVITICVQLVSVPNFSRLFTFQTQGFSSETCRFDAVNCYVLHKTLNVCGKSRTGFVPVINRFAGFYVMFYCFFKSFPPKIFALSDSLTLQ